MRIPVATYRLQFNQSFSFQQAETITPYLKRLGISDIYASPILQSKKGSQHGYDMIHFGKIDPQLGGEKDFQHLSRSCKKLGLGWLQDIVPNHMAYHPSNPFLYDLLKKGKESVYHDYFDIDWHSPIPELQGKILFPFLEKDVMECLKEKLLALHYQKEQLFLQYREFYLPINPQGYREIIHSFLSVEQWPEQSKIYLEKDTYKILKQWKHECNKSPANQKLQHGEQPIKWVLQNFRQKIKKNCKLKKAFLFWLKQLNHAALESYPLSIWHKILSQQYYHLAFWKMASKKINYRRFFSINELISLQVERKKVFNAIHACLFKAVHKKEITGLRIDHIDGLFNPAQYCQRVKTQLPDIYLVAEKILQPEEELPSHFTTQGTTGYDFLYHANNLFCQSENSSRIKQIYQDFIKKNINVSQLQIKKKKMILKQQMDADLQNLTQLFLDYYQKNHLEIFPSLNQINLKQVLTEVMIRLPVYRTYISPLKSNRKDIVLIMGILEKINTIFSELNDEIDYIKTYIIKPVQGKGSTPKKQDLFRLIMRWQQFTGPLMAKGVEDTLLYCYNPLISLNEVGGNIESFGISKQNFFQFIVRRQYWPHSMNTTSTHDNKRGEDVRARINVLSEIPECWQKKVNHWHRLNLNKKQKIKSHYFPENNMEYFLYQTLIGTLPFAGCRDISATYINRIKNYLIKSAREAKIYTSWLNSNSFYENSLLDFMEQIMLPGKDNAFLKDLLSFAKIISHYGILNSLSQLSIKVTAPGVPDFYQGTELWNFNLVDPDNRHPVDFNLRQLHLKEIQQLQEKEPLCLLKSLLKNPNNGKIKLYLTYQLLKLRHKENDIFRKGSFYPLPIRGKYQHHVIAYLRESKYKGIIVIVPRFLARIVRAGQYPFGENIWKNTSIQLPFPKKETGIDWVSQQTIKINPILKVSQTLKYFPVSVILYTKRSTE